MSRFFFFMAGGNLAEAWQLHRHNESDSLASAAFVLMLAVAVLVTIAEARRGK